MNCHNTQSGNVLFYILIAVALLAALSYAVSNSGRGRADMINEERARLIAAEIIEYGDAIASAVTQIRLRGYDDTQINFEGITPATPANANCTEDICSVFALNGGAVNVVEGNENAQPSGATFNFNISGTMEVESVGTTCGAANCSELLFFFRDLKEEVCVAINDLLGIDNPIGAPPSHSDLAYTPFSGTYVYQETIGNEVSSSGLEGLNTGCVEEAADGTFNYYRVLIAR